MAALHHLYDVVSVLSTIEWGIIVVIWIASTGALFWLFFRWFLRRQWQLYRNLKRPIVLLRPVLATGAPVADGDLTQEYNLIQRTGFLNIQAPTDYRSFNPAGNHCIVVLGYKAGMAGLDEVLARLKSNHVPLILYTYGNVTIRPEDKLKLDSYPYALMANFPLTLLNHIYSTAASFPYAS